MNASHIALIAALAALAMVLVAALAALGSDVPQALTTAITVTTGGIVAGGVVIGADGIRQANTARSSDALNEKFKNNVE